MPITNFPEQGGDSPVSLRSSRYPLFPLDEAQALKDEWPEIWDRGGNILGNRQFNRLAPMARDRRSPETDTEEEAVRLREAWAARHLEDFRLAGVVAQIKWLVIGSRGLDHMRDVIMSEKERLRDRREFRAPLSLKDGKASFVMTTDALDRQGEVVEVDGWDFGNFMKNPVILDTHRYESIEDIVGKAVGEPRREGSGWVVDIEFAATERGKVAKTLVEQGMLNAVSVGFRSTQRRKEGRTMHHVQKELLEVSLVAIPANPTALRVKAVQPFGDLPLAPDDLEWNQPAAQERVRRWASSDGSGDKDSMDWERYARAFMLVREGMEEDFGGYGYPFADVVEDRLVAHIRPIQIIANILAGGQGGGNLSPEDRRRMARVVERYYDKAGVDLPESVAELAKGSYMDKPMEEEQGMGGDKPKKPMAKNEQLMSLRDHLVAAAAVVDAMLEGYDEDEEMPEEEAPVVEDSAKAGGSGQDYRTPETLVSALKAAVAAIGGPNK